MYHHHQHHQHSFCRTLSDQHPRSQRHFESALCCTRLLLHLMYTCYSPWLPSHQGILLPLLPASQLPARCCCFPPGPPCCCYAPPPPLLPQRLERARLLPGGRTEGLAMQQDNGGAAACHTEHSRNQAWNANSQNQHSAGSSVGVAAGQRPRGSANPAPPAPLLTSSVCTRCRPPTL